MRISSEIDTNAPSRPWSERRWLVTTCQLALLVVLLGGWQLSAAHSKYVPEVFGSPKSVSLVLWHWAVGPDKHWADLFSTVQGAATGFAVGTGVAVVLTLVFVLVPVIGKLFSGYVAAFNAIPKVVLAPLFILWFGVGLEAKTYFVASIIFIVMFYNMYVGVKSIDPIYLTQARVLGAHRLWELRAVFLPALIGWIVVSLRVSVAFALLSAVVAEYLGSTKGIGHLISEGESTLAPSQVLAGVVVVGLMTIIVDALLRATESHFTQWRTQ